MSVKDKVLRQLSQVLLVRDSTGAFGSTALNATAAAGQKVLNVPSTTNFAVGDLIRVGSGETIELAIVASLAAGVSLTVTDNLTFDHASGEAVVEQTAYDVGDLTDAGATVTGSSQTTDVAVATKRLVYTVLNGYDDLSIAFALPGFTLYNFAFATGTPLTKIAGNGTPATPLALATDGSDFAGEANQSIIAIGVTMDGTPIRAELWGVDADYTQLKSQLARGVLGSVPCRFVASAGGVITTNASAYVPNTVNRPNKGKVIDGLTEVGLFADATTGPLSTLVGGATPATAGAVTFSVVATTNLAVGDWVRIGSGDTVEFHRVDSFVANTSITLRTPILRAHATGEAVVRQQQVPFAGVSTDGASLEVSGSVEAIRIATRRLSAGIKPGLAAMLLRFALTDLSLASFARAFGIPASAIASGRLPITGTNIGTDVVQGVYVKAVLQDGTIAWVNLWGCSQDLSNVAVQLQQAGVPSLPVAFKPSSGLHLIQHS